MDKASLILTIGMVIGFIVRLDQIITERATHDSDVDDVGTNYIWFTVSLALSSAKAALVMYGLYTLISIKVKDMQVAMVSAGFTTIAYEPIWKFAQIRIARRINRTADDIDTILE